MIAWVIKVVGLCVEGSYWPCLFHLVRLVWFLRCLLTMKYFVHYLVELNSNCWRLMAVFVKQEDHSYFHLLVKTEARQSGTIKGILW